MSICQLTIPEVKISEPEMQRAFYSMNSQRYELMALNLYLGWCGCEMDIFGLRPSGFIDEIEIKLSASDFKADWKKTVAVKCDPYTPENVFNPCEHKHCAKCRGTGKVINDSYYDKAGDPCGYQTRYAETTNIDIQKHKALAEGKHSCNYFSFYMPAGIVDKCEIPEYAGLYVFEPNGRTNITEVKKPKRLHTRKISDYNKYHTAKKMHYRFWDMFMRQARK